MRIFGFAGTYSLLRRRNDCTVYLPSIPTDASIIGFDKLANALQNAGESQSFPPYNIEEKVMITTTALPLRWRVSVRKI